jgi:hypothetical protein
MGTASDQTALATAGESHGAATDSKEEKNRLTFERTDQWHLPFLSVLESSSVVRRPVRKAEENSNLRFLYCS